MKQGAEEVPGLSNLGLREEMMGEASVSSVGASKRKADTEAMVGAVTCSILRPQRVLTLHHTCSRSQFPG